MKESGVIVASSSSVHKSAINQAVNRLEVNLSTLHEHSLCIIHISCLYYK